MKQSSRLSASTQLRGANTALQRKPQRRRAACSPCSAAAASFKAPSRSPTNLEFELLADCADADLAVELQHITPSNRGLFASENFSRIHAIDLPVTSTLCVCTTPSANGAWFRSYIAGWQEQHAPLPPLLLQFLQDKQESDFVRLCIFLLWARDCDAELWARYVGLLPKSRDLCCLLNYTREEALELQLPSMQEDVEASKTELRAAGLRLLNRTNGFLKSLGLPESLEDFLWAAGVVQSRSVHWRLLGDEEVLMLPPVADCVNHSFQPNCEMQLSPDFARLQVNPLRPISQWEEVTIAYVSRATSGDLMRDYGFVLQGNPFDELDFSEVDLGGVKLRGELLCHVLQAQGSFRDRSLRLGGQLPATVAEAIKRNRTKATLLSLPVVEDPTLHGAEGSQGALPALTSNELGLQRQAAQTLRDACQRMHWSFGTGWETDQQMLQAASSLNLSPRMVTAIQCRMEHKLLLQAAVDVLDAYLKYLREN